MKLRNTTDQRIDLPTLGLSAEPGKTVDVTGQAAHSLLSQGDTWKRADKPKPKTKTTATPAKTTEAPASDKGD